MLDFIVENTGIFVANTGVCIQSPISNIYVKMDWAIDFSQQDSARTLDILRVHSTTTCFLSFDNAPR